MEPRPGGNQSAWQNLFGLIVAGLILRAMWGAFWDEANKQLAEAEKMQEEILGFKPKDALKEGKKMYDDQWKQLNDAMDKAKEMQDNMLRGGH